MDYVAEVGKAGGDRLGLPPLAVLLLQTHVIEHLTESHPVAPEGPYGVAR